MTAGLEVQALTPDRWPDLETLFGRSGAWGGCWCMWFRMRSSEAQKSTSAKNKTALKALVDADQPPGLLAYVNGEVAGWVSLDRRERFPHLEHSRKLKRIDAEPVWSIVCFVVGRRFRRQGLMAALLNAAVDYAGKQGARIVEAYPLESTREQTGFDGFSGIASTFRKAGFAEVKRVSEKQLMMRKEVW